MLRVNDFERIKLLNEGGAAKKWMMKLVSYLGALP